ncbi:MAG TPA: ABC transporter permease [Gaiellaceae bacterium]|nr:ABC transporter permease [Gaiellaceae bacterium]
MSSSKIDIQAQDAVPVEALPVEGGQQVKARGYWELVWIRFRRDKLALISIGFVVFLLFASFIGGPIMKHVLGHGPNTIFANGVDQHSLAPVGPWTHISNADYVGETPAVFQSAHPGQHLGTALLPLGADGSLGRDLFLRLLYGAQTSLEVAVLATLGSVALGVLMGLLAGYFRGWVDTVVSRLIEVVMVFPALLFIIAVRVVAGPQLNSITFGFLARGVFTLVLIFSVIGWFYPARIIRGVVFSLREKEFVEAARMTGASDFRIMRSHLLPHLVAPIVVYSTLIIAANILGEAGLSFLGLGIEQPTASWGNLLAAAPDFYLTQPWLMVWPGLSILLTTLAFNLLGDGLRDAFDPRARI